MYASLVKSLHWEENPIMDILECWCDKVTNILSTISLLPTMYVY